MKKILILILVGIIPILSSQTIFKDSYLLSQNIVNSYRFVGISIPTDSLVAYYPFNGNANDESGNGNNGTFVNAVYGIDRYGNSNNSASFDSSRYVQIPQIINNEPVISLNFWVYMRSLNEIPNTYYPFIFSDIFGDFAFFLSTTKWRFQVRMDNSTQYNKTFTTAPDASIDEWNMYTIIIDANNNFVKFYYNGNFISEFLIAGNYILTRVNYIWIGRGQSGATVYYIDANVDDIRIYNRVLTTDEITALYNE